MPLRICQSIKRIRHWFSSKMKVILRDPLYPLKIHLGFVSPLRLSPFTWNFLTDRLELQDQNDTRSWWLYYSFTFIHTSYVMFLLVSLLLFTRDDHIGYRLLLAFYFTPMLGVVIFSLCYLRHMKDICYLMNLCIGAIRRNKAAGLKDSIVPTLAMIYAVWVPLLGFILPLIYLVKPCLSQTLRMTLLDCSAPDLIPLHQRMLAYSVEVPFYFLTSSLGYMAFILPMYVADFLNQLLLLIVSRRNGSNLKPLYREYFLGDFRMTPGEYELKGQVMLYRQIQILSNLCNSAFQMYTLPVLQGLGTINLIAGLYIMIELRTEFPGMSFIALPFLSLLVMTVTVIELELASYVLLRSKKVLGRNWKSEKCGKFKWFRKVARSCPQLKLKTGAFHAVTRERLVIMMRFILQRTFFLIVCGRRR